MGLNHKAPNAIMGVAFAAMLAASAGLLPSLMTAGTAFAAPANLTVNAVSTSGSVLNMYATIQSGATTVGTGFTPLSITGNTGTTYTITPSDYNGITFARWEDGSTARTRSLTLNSATTITAYYNTNSAPSGACAPLAVPAVTASGNDGNVPANTLDNSLSTRWSNFGKGSWIRYDLGQSQTVCSLDIAWYKGNERQNSFTVDVSQDGAAFTTVYTGKSSGTTANAEKYDIPDTAARYVRVTVNGNTVNDWASITEVDVYGTGSSASPPPATLDTTIPDINISSPAQGATLQPGTVSVTGTATDNSGGSGIKSVQVKVDGGAYLAATPKAPGDWSTWSASVSITAAGSHTIGALATDNAGNTDTSSVGISIASTTTSQPPPPSSSSADKWGVKMLYPTKSSGEQWFMNMDSATSDSRFNAQSSISKNSDGSWKMTSSKVRMNVYTSSGYHPERISTYNQKSLATKGYMQDANDWKNVEITGFVKLNSSPGNDNFAWYGRGGKHTDSNGGCEGTAYKGDLYFAGGSRFAKEQQHADGYSFTPTTSATGSLNGRWVGFKTVMYNNAQGNVVLQNWINDNADKTTWKKVYEKVDSTGWGSDGDMCGGNPDQKITWGGPIVTFRWDTATNVDFKWLSVREIQPPT